MIFKVVVVVLILCSRVVAQTMPQDIKIIVPQGGAEITISFKPLTIEPPVVEPPAVVVMPEKFVLYHDTIPNFAYSYNMQSVKDGKWSDVESWWPKRLPTAADVVVVGHKISYDVDSGEVKVVGVVEGGKLSFDNSKKTKLVVQTVLVMKSGQLEVGTVQQPAQAEIVVRDAAIDLVQDPSQYGNGIVVIDGSVVMYGKKKESFVRVGTEVKAGDTTIQLEKEVVGWEVGDRLVVADSRQLKGNEVTAHDQENNVHRIVSQTEVVEVVSVVGNVVKVKDAVKYDHLGVRDSKGVVSFLPHVGNLSRSVVVRSEKVTGTRGHSLFTGRSHVDVQYVSFVGLGRTKAEPLDSSVVNSNGIVEHLGKNQIGRYPLHNHHNFGLCDGREWQYKYVGNAVEESGRWGLTVHGSHYGLIAENVVYNVKGAGIVTEDGSETGNLFQHNFVVRSENITKVTIPEASSNSDPLGRKGNGFWLRGPGSVLKDNVVADTREGYGFYTGSAEGGAPDGPEMSVQLPLKRCSDTTKAAERYFVDKLFKVKNAGFEGNEVYSTSEMGIGVWVNTGEGEPFRNVKIWHSYGTALFMKYTDPRIEGLVIRNSRGEGLAISQQNNFGYGAALLKDADIQGVSWLYVRSGQITLAPNVEVKDSYFQSRNGWLLDANGQSNGAGGSYWTFRNVKFEGIEGQPLKTLVTAFVDQGDRFATKRVVYVRDWQGKVGDNFRLWWLAQGQAGPAATWFGEIAPCQTKRDEIVGFVCP